jgi:hypothetical protein
VKICLLKSKWFPQKQGKSYDNSPKPKRAHNVLNLSDKVNFLDLLKDNMSLGEVRLCYGENESNICRVRDKEHEIRSIFCEQYQCVQQPFL